MVKKYKSAIIFSVSLIAVFLIITTLLRFAIANTKDTNLKRWWLFYNEPANADLVLLGSSRIHRHLDPIILESKTGLITENIAIGGANLPLIRAIYKDYLMINKSPKLLIIGFDSFSFEKLDDYFPFPHLFYFTGPSNTHIADISDDPLSYLFKEFSFIKYNEKLWHLLIHSELNQHVQGYLPKGNVFDEDMNKFIAKNPNGITKDINDQVIEGWHQFILEIKNIGTNIVFVYTPEFYQIYPVIKNREDIFSEIHKIADQHGIVFYNFGTESFKMNYNQDLFYNSQHLNIKGSKIYSAIFGDSLQKYLRDIKY